jgi:hypothetical protein
MIKLMFKNSQNQIGSAHVVIVIILIVAIMGLLGFIVWQKFIYKQPTTIETNTTDTFQKVDTKTETPLVKVDEKDYSFTVVEGFSESTEQQFTYTGSLKATKTFVNKDGDYFEVLSHYGDGGGMSADYFWGYTIQNGSVALDKKPQCTESSSFCTADNGSVEGVISNTPDKYYFAFGNKTKNEMNLEYVDKFISSVKFK